MLGSVPEGQKPGISPDLISTTHLLFKETTPICTVIGNVMTEKEITSGVSIETPCTALTETKEVPKAIHTPTVTNATEGKAKRKRKRRRKRVRIGDALRCEGLDEREVAQKLRSVIEKETPDTTDKMRAEIL